MHVESDSSFLEWIRNGLNSMHPCYDVIESYRTFFKHNSFLVVNHVFRESNIVADHLANLSLDYSLGLHILDSIP